MLDIPYETYRVSFHEVARLTETCCSLRVDAAKDHDGADGATFLSTFFSESLNL